ncbi:MAG: hypothetical protein ABUS79_04735 [Pseudomonadota bacterium]
MRGGRGARATGVSHRLSGAVVAMAALVTAAITGLTGLTGLTGCQGPSGQFFVVQNQVPTDGCTIPAEKGQYRGQGVLDVRVPNISAETGYFLFPLLQNDLPVDSDDGVEPNRIALTGFEVDVTVVDGSAAARDFFAALSGDPAGAALMRFQSPWSGSIDPGGGNLAAATTAVPAEMARRLRDEDILAGGTDVRINAHVRAVGNKLGARVSSDTFTYPIRICDGCLINSVTACPRAGEVLSGSACNPGQDSLVDCCTDGSTLVCPATRAQ